MGSGEDQVAVPGEGQDAKPSQGVELAVWASLVPDKVFLVSRCAWARQHPAIE